MVTRVHPSSFAALILATAIALPPASAAATTQVAPAAAKEPTTPSGWLRAGEARERESNFTGAGEAYRKALEALSPKKQRANEGAQAAVLSAEAYISAFEADGEVGHLQLGFEVLDMWLQQAGPNNRATQRDRVERTMAQIRAIRDPLLQSKASLEQGKVDEATEHSKAAIEALSYQQRDWSTGARIALQTAQAQVTAYERSVEEVEDIEPNLRKLENAKLTLQELQSKRPADDESEEGTLVQQRLVELDARIEQEQQRLDAEQLAEQQREAAARAEEERKRQQALEQARQQAAAGSEATDAARARKRTLGILLLATGAVTAGAGAGVLGEGLAFAPEAERQGDAEQAEADALQQMFGDAYARDDFDRSLQQYRDDAQRRTTGMIAGGSVLLAAGVGAAVVGTIMLVRNRRSKGSGSDREKVGLAPSVSRSHVHLSLTARF